MKNKQFFPPLEEAQNLEFELRLNKQCWFVVQTFMS